MFWCGERCEKSAASSKQSRNLKSIKSKHPTRQLFGMIICCLLRTQHKISCGKALKAGEAREVMKEMQKGEALVGDDEDDEGEDLSASVARWMAEQEREHHLFAWSGQKHVFYFYFAIFSQTLLRTFGPLFKVELIEPLACP